MAFKFNPFSGVFDIVAKLSTAALNIFTASQTFRPTGNGAAIKLQSDAGALARDQWEIRVVSDGSPTGVRKLQIYNTLRDVVFEIATFTGSTFVEGAHFKTSITAGDDGFVSALVFYVDSRNGNIFMWDGAALRQIKIGSNNTGPGGVGRALYIDNA